MPGTFYRTRPHSCVCLLVASIHPVMQRPGSLLANLTTRMPDLPRWLQRMTRGSAAPSATAASHRSAGWQARQEIESDLAARCKLHDRIMPTPKKQADTIMNWASGEKELKYYPEAEHCTVDRLDEVFPYIIDWLKNKLI